MRSIIFAVAILITLNSQASSMTNVTIKNLHVNRDTGQVLIGTSTLAVDQPGRISCHSGNGWNYIFSLTNIVDQATYSILLSAYVSQKPVNIAGKGACPLVGQNNIEALLSVTAIQ